MTDHDALAALLRSMQAGDEPVRLALVFPDGGVSLTIEGAPVADGLATYLHAAGVRVTGDAGLDVRIFDAIAVHVGAMQAAAITEDVLAALTGDTPEAGSHRPDGAHWPSCRTCGEDWPCSAATHAAGVRVTGDAGLRVVDRGLFAAMTRVCEGAALLTDADPRSVAGAVRFGLLRADVRAWREVQDALRAALTGDTPEADRIGQDKE